MEEEIVKKRALKSVIWKFLERFGAQIVSLIVSIIIARIFSPEDYSVVSFVTIFFVFADVLITGGFNTALMQKKDVDEEDYSVVLYLSLFISIIVYFILFFTAPLIAKLYKLDTLVLVIRIMGLVLPITAIKSIWCAYISSQLLFKKFFFATIIGTVISGVVGIVMAIKGYGYWSLVAQQMINTIIDTSILILTTRINLVVKPSFSRLKVLFNYGWKILVSSLIATIYSQIVPLIIGIRYSKADLAFYTKAKSFPDLVVGSTTSTFAAVLFPTLAKFQDDDSALLRYTRYFINISSFIAFPLMLGLFAVSDNFISIILTDKWLPAVPFMRIFCLASMFEMIHVGNCETIKAKGRSDVYLIMEIIKKSLYFITIGFFVFFAKDAYDLAFYTVVCTIIALIVNSIPNRKMLKYNYGSQLKDILPSLISALIMAICVLLIGKININKILLLFIQVISGIFIYLIINIIIKNKSLTYLFNFIKKRDKKCKD